MKRSKGWGTTTAMGETGGIRRKNVHFKREKAKESTCWAGLTRNDLKKGGAG